MAIALIYSNINSYTVSEFILNVEKAEQEGEELTVRINSDGGQPDYGYGMIASLLAFKGTKNIKVDGKAHSTALYFCAACEDVEALDVSEFVLHRAAYAKWFEDSEYFTDELKANLDRTNKHLKQIFESKVDIEKLKAIMEKRKDYTGTYEEIWSMEGRVSFYITAKEAKSIGLISKITNVTKKKIETVNAFVQASIENGDMSGKGLFLKEIESKPVAKVKEEKKENNKKTSMNATEFQAQHPEAYKAIVVGATTKERQRISAWTKFSDVDPEKVKEAIASGEQFGENQEVLAELMLKKANPTQPEAANGGKTPEAATTNPVDKPAGDLTPEQTALANAKANMSALVS